MPQARDIKGRFASASNNGGPTLALIRHLNDMGDETWRDAVFNMNLAQRRLGKETLDSRRDINEECGYPKPITVEDYRLMYDREPIAARVVEVLPDECWKVSPDVYEEEDADERTAFDRAWGDVANHLRGTSWYRGEAGNVIWEHLHRVDVLSGIGHFGVLLLGLDDGKALKEAVDGIDPKTGASEGVSTPTRKLMYLRCFDEYSASIGAYETDQACARYGQPVSYNINFAEYRQAEGGAVAPDQSTHSVHWSRVIHIADNLGSSEVIGTPRQQKPFNRLFDLRKTYGAAGEGYWRGAFPGISIETHPEIAGNVTVDTAGIRTSMEKYMTGLQRYILLMGLTAKSLAPQVVDPGPQLKAFIESICIQIGVPVRVFMGSERGELASTQDERAWNGRLAARQNNYVTPRIIVPFVDRLIGVGVLPVPEQHYVTWPDLESLSPEQEATIAVKQTEAMAKYVGGGVEGLMPPMEYLTRIMGLSQDEAQAVIEAAVEALPEEEEEDEAVGEEPVEEEGREKVGA